MNSSCPFSTSEYLEFIPILNGEKFSFRFPGELIWISNYGGRKSQYSLAFTPFSNFMTQWLNSFLIRLFSSQIVFGFCARAAASAAAPSTARLVRRKDWLWRTPPRALETYYNYFIYIPFAEINWLSSDMNSRLLFHSPRSAFDCLVNCRRRY